MWHCTAVPAQLAAQLSFVAIFCDPVSPTTFLTVSGHTSVKQKYVITHTSVAISVRKKCFLHMMQACFYVLLFNYTEFKYHVKNPQKPDELPGKSLWSHCGMWGILFSPFRNNMSKIVSLMEDFTLHHCSTDKKKFSEDGWVIYLHRDSVYHSTW